MPYASLSSLARVRSQNRVPLVELLLFECWPEELVEEARVANVFVAAEVELVGDLQL